MSLKLLYEKENGNYKVRLMSDGTKLRLSDTQDSLVAEQPESIDIKITDYCTLNCPYCHENSSSIGKHAEIETIKKRLNGLYKCEIAIGGGDPLSYPELYDLLIWLRKQEIIPNITINFKSITYDTSVLISRMLRNGLFGIGVSSPKNNTFIYNNVVAHTILGVDDIIKTISDYNKVLILGYKNYGRGKNFINDSIRNNISYIFHNIDKLFTYPGKIISFDNLAIKQLGLKSRLPKKMYKKFFMGQDGKFTMYYDAVKDEFAKSSVSKRQDANKYETALNFFKELNSD